MIVEFAWLVTSGMVRRGREVDMDDLAGRMPDAAEIAEINARHLITTPLKPADLLFVFGTREGVDEFVEAIVKLWREGFCRHILISGGPTWNNPDAEAFVLRRAILESVAAEQPRDRCGDALARQPRQRPASLRRDKAK